MEHELAVTASWVFDGFNAVPEAAGVLVREGTVERLLDVSEVMGSKGIPVHHYEGCTLMPGMINCHSHTVMPGDGTPIEEAMQGSDDMLLLRASRNAMWALEAGVTTLADLGGRNDVTFTLRQAIDAGVVTGSKLLLAGRAITSKRGHCWLWNGEVENEEFLRRLARELFAQGADLLKIMGTGGGTRGTNPSAPQFEPH